MQGILDSLQLALNALKDNHHMSLSKARGHIREAVAIAKQERSVELNEKFAAKVGGPMRRTWEAIASDASQLEGRMTESGARELVLDADRSTGTPRSASFLDGM